MLFRSYDAGDGTFQPDWPACAVGAIQLQFRATPHQRPARLKMVRRSNNPPARSVYRVSNRRTQTPSYPVMVADWAIFLRSVLRSRKILMQNRATLRNALRKRNYESPSVSNDMQSSERLRNSLVLNTNQLLYQLSYAGIYEGK